MLRSFLARRFPRLGVHAVSCRAVQRQLQRYLDGALDERRVALLVEHLGECDHCEFEGATYTRIKQSLASQRADVAGHQLSGLEQFTRGLTQQRGAADS